jgi:hypothetical protein
MGFGLATRSSQLLPPKMDLPSVQHYKPIKELKLRVFKPS